jgi:hypothetical protein
VDLAGFRGEADYRDFVRRACHPPAGQSQEGVGRAGKRAAPVSEMAFDQIGITEMLGRNGRQPGEPPCHYHLAGEQRHVGVGETDGDSQGSVMCGAC